MNKVKVVSAYIPLPDIINVSQEKFQELGVALASAIPCNLSFYDVPDPERRFGTWMATWVQKQPWADEVTCSDPDPDPARFAGDRFKTKLWSNYVMHEKSVWVGKASFRDQTSDVFVWIDYGVLKQANMTPETVTRFIKELEAVELPDAVIAPGIRATADEPDPAMSWDRFCGSVVIVPRKWVDPLACAMLRDAIHTTTLTKKVTIESNTLARVERQQQIPFHWYQSGWGASMFDSFLGRFPK